VASVSPLSPSIFVLLTFPSDEKKTSCFECASRQKPCKIKGKNVSGRRSRGKAEESEGKGEGTSGSKDKGKGRARAQESEGVPTVGLSEESLDAIVDAVVDEVGSKVLAQLKVFEMKLWERLDFIEDRVERMHRTVKRMKESVEDLEVTMDPGYPSDSEKSSEAEAEDQAETGVSAEELEWLKKPFYGEKENPAPPKSRALSEASKRKRDDGSEEEEEKEEDVDMGPESSNKKQRKD
jgi:hypothetical protein